MDPKLYDYLLQTLQDIYTEIELVRNEDDDLKRTEIIDHYLKESINLLVEEINLLIQHQSSSDRENAVEIRRLQEEIKSLKKRWFIF